MSEVDERDGDAGDVELTSINAVPTDNGGKDGKVNGEEAQSNESSLIRSTEQQTENSQSSQQPQVNTEH